MEMEYNPTKVPAREQGVDSIPASSSNAPRPSISLSPCLPVSLSPTRAWCYLVWLSWQRQARARQMVWIAAGLLVFTVLLVAIFTAAGTWSMRHHRWPYRQGLTYVHWADEIQVLMSVRDASAGGQGLQAALAASVRGIIDQSGFMVYSRWIVFSIFLSFLLPLWSLSFATEALGGERESNSLVWLLSRPLPRPAIYLAKFVALLPWSIGFNVGGFGLLCLVAGQPGGAGVSAVLAGRAVGDVGLFRPVLFHGCLFPPSGGRGPCLRLLSRSDLRQHAGIPEAHQHRLLHALYDV